LFLPPVEHFVTTPADNGSIFSTQRLTAIRLRYHRRHVIISSMLHFGLRLNAILNAINNDDTNIAQTPQCRSH
jgi:hypothetical protein